MKIQVEDKKLFHRSTQFLNPTHEYLGIDLSIYLLEIVIRIGRHFPIILLSSASINIILATNDLLANSLTFAVINLVFALGNFIFLIQLHQRKKITSNEHKSFSIESTGELS